MRFQILNYTFTPPSGHPNQVSHDQFPYFVDILKDALVLDQRVEDETHLEREFCFIYIFSFFNLCVGFFYEKSFVYFFFFTKKFIDILINVFNMIVGNIIKKNYNILYNRSMRINSFELHFSLSYFSSQPNTHGGKQKFLSFLIFHLFTFLSLQPNGALASHTCAWVRLRNS